MDQLTDRASHRPWRLRPHKGYTTSAGYGHTLGGSVGLGYVTHKGGVDEAYISEGTFTIEQADRTYSASASLTPLYDPKSLRPKS